MKVSSAALLFSCLLASAGAISESPALRALKKDNKKKKAPAPGPDSTPVNPAPTDQTIAGFVDGTILGTALEITGLLPVFEGPGSFTVFAPTDEAFLALNKINENVLTCLTKNDFKALLAVILKYHAAVGKFLSTDLSDGQKIQTLAASGKGLGEVTVTIDDGIFIDESEVIAPDNDLSNGVIHLIDAVLLDGPFDLGLLVSSGCLEDPDAFDGKDCKNMKC